jgi:hypothetical protein
MRSEREKALISETRVLWQKRYASFLSEDEAKDIITNVTDFFTLLHEWDQQSNAACNDAHAAKESTGGEHAA